MALKEIELTDLVDALDELENGYADFFRPMLGYEAILTLYEGIDDSVESLLTEIEDETGIEFPSDLIEFYLNTNGGNFGDLRLFPLYDDKEEKTIHKLNVLDKDLKFSIGLSNSELLVGHYEDTDDYIIAKLEDKQYVYQLWDGAKKAAKMNFEYVAQLVALEINYVSEYEE